MITILSFRPRLRVSRSVFVAAPTFNLNSCPSTSGDRPAIRRKCLDHMIVFGEAHLRPDPWQVCRLMKRGLIDRWTRMHRFIGRSSTSASSHHDLFSTACITNIADSDFLHAPEVDSVRSRGRRRGRPPTVKRQRAGTNLPRLNPRLNALFSLGQFAGRPNN